MEEGCKGNEKCHVIQLFERDTQAQVLNVAFWNTWKVYENGLN